MSTPPENSHPRPATRLFIWMGGFAPIGGIETFIADLGASAVRAGFEVEMLAWDRRSPLLRRLREAGVRLICSPWRWACRWHLPDWIIFPLGLWKSRNADVVVFAKTATHTMHALFQRFARNRGQRFIYITPYRPAELWGDDITGHPPRLQAVTAMLQTFDLIICQNDVFASDLRGLGYRGPLEMLPNLPPRGVENPAPYPPDGPLTLGFLGRLEHQKNLPEMLRVFALLRSEKSARGDAARPVRLCLFGEGSLRTELENRARELGIASSVEFHGAIPRDRVRAAIQSCHVFCFTSHSEGQPIASLEILAEGRPIIATAVGAFPNMLTDPALGQVVPVGDTAGFLSAVKAMLARQQAGDVAPLDTVKAYQARFDREQTVRRYIELLSSGETAPGPGVREAGATA